MSPATRRHTRPAHLALAVLVVTLTGLLGACGAGSTESFSSSDSSSDSSSGGGSAAAPERPPAAPEVAEDPAAAAGESGDTRGGVAVESARAVISTGTVSLRSPDVAQALFDAQTAIDQYAAEVAERTSDTDEDGGLRRSRLVLRVPADSFGDLMGALESTGTLISSTSSSEDVTAQVIDTDVRVSVQKASIQRVQALLAQAVDLDDVVAIEAELSSRQAELNSLEQTSAYLADQTSLSTITLTLERTNDTEPPPAQDDESGFLAGLSSGWDALATFGTGLATVVGALLPWAVVAGVVALPVTVLARRLRRRTPGPAATAPSP